MLDRPPAKLKAGTVPGLVAWLSSMTSSIGRPTTTPIIGDRFSLEDAGVPWFVIPASGNEKLFALLTVFLGRPSRSSPSVLAFCQSRKRNGQRGVIGFGEILSAPDDGYYEATGEPALFVRIRSEAILNPFQEPNLILSREHLLSLGLTQFKFVRQSGTWIDIAKGVSDLFVAQLKLGRMLQQKTIKLAA
jgi:hypothetical protein